MTADLYLQLAGQHGHYCPMSTLGLRLGLTALQGIDRQVWAFRYFARTCAVDGISLTLARGGMQNPLDVVSQGQHLLRCHSATGRELSFSLTDEVLRLANQYQDLNDKGKQQQLDLPHYCGGTAYSDDRIGE